jgi:hypothetical protein
MNGIFSIQNGFQVPDGTVVYPFLNPKDSTSDLPWDLLEGFSIAAGDIAPQSASKIQVLPLAAQVTFVLHGALQIIAKEPLTPASYTLQLTAEQAAIQRPGTFFQLINPTDALCRVLYIVSPPYVFDQHEGAIRYDDSLVFDEGWQALADLKWQPPALRDGRATPEARRAALERIRMAKFQRGKP